MEKNPFINSEEEQAVKDELQGNAVEVIDSPPIKKRMYRVYRLNCDQSETDVEIFIGGNTIKERVVFMPGELVELTETQLANLKNAVRREKHIIPPGSGIYRSPDPVAAASVMFPGYGCKSDPRTGRLYLYRNSPKYSIQLEEV